MPESVKLASVRDGTQTNSPSNPAPDNGSHPGPGMGFDSETDDSTDSSQNSIESTADRSTEAASAATLNSNAPPGTEMPPT